VINNHTNDIIYAVTKRISTLDATVGESQVALLATHIAGSYGVDNLILEEDSINNILAIQNSKFFVGWNFANVIADIKLNLLIFPI
jgi:hypothetical protein